MPVDQQTQIDALRRTVVLLAEAVGEVISEVDTLDLYATRRLSKTQGKLDAIAPLLDAPLGPAAGDGRDGGGGDG